MELLGVELHGAVLEAPLAQLLGQAVEGADLPSVLVLVALLSRVGCRLSGAVLHAVVLEHLLGLLVGVAAVGANDGVHDAEALHVGLVIEVEDDREGQLVLIGAERADEVAEPFGQHRYGAVDEIDGRGALHGLLVDDTPLGDIVRHVGDVHAHLVEPLVELLDGEGVVEVLGVGGVDGAGPRVAEVLALGHVLRRDLARDGVGRVLHVLRVLVGQPVLGQDGVHLHVVVATLTEHVHHLSDEVLVLLVGPLYDFHHYLVVGLAALELLLRYEDVVGEGTVLRHAEGDVLVDAQASHKLVLGALENLDDLRLLDMLLPACHERHLHAVAVERRHRVALGHEDGLVAPVGDE